MEPLFITNLTIEKVRHLNDIFIPLSKEKTKHLIFTGKNGSGKTSIIEALAGYLNSVFTDQYFGERKGWLNIAEKKRDLAIQEGKDEADIFKLENDVVIIDVKDVNDEVHERTALLVTETFSLKNTGMRTYSSDERLKLLQKEMNLLYRQLEKIHSNPDSPIVMRTLRSLLKRESAFAAFKRCYVREHVIEYPELQKYVELDG